MESLTTSERVQALVNEVKLGIARVCSSEDWMKFLEYSARFWKYSFHNQMLIALQCSSASRVAGFHSWKEMGRWVKKGESGIRILAPLLVKVKAEDGRGSLEEGYVIRGFKNVCVFDVSQTEGEELPSVVHALTGEGPGGLFFRLKEFAESRGFTVRFEDMDGSRFGYVDRNLEIALKAGAGNAQHCKTLCHEIAHGLLGHLPDKELSREEKELEAETTAWVVCRNLGLETSDYSFGYLATWAPSKDRDVKIEKCAGRACECAKDILEGLEKIGLGLND